MAINIKGSRTNNGHRMAATGSGGNRMKRVSSFVLVGIGIFIIIFQMSLLFYSYPIIEIINIGEEEEGKELTTTTTASSSSTTLGMALSFFSTYYSSTTSRSSKSKSTTTNMELQLLSSTTNTKPSPVVLSRNRPVKTKKKKKYQRIYCIVPFLWQPPKSTARYEEIMNTWGHRCDYIRFMIDPIIGSFDTFFTDVRTNETARSTLPDNVRIINMTRPWNRDCIFVNENLNDKEKLHGAGNYLNGKVCRHLWEKMWKTWTYVNDYELDLADWFVKIDWDCYFFPNHLRHYINVNGYSSEDRHYIGHSLHQHQSTLNTSFIAGANEILSKTTIKDIVPHLLEMPSEKIDYDRFHCRDRPLDGEDVTMAICLAKHLNLFVEPARTAIFGCDYIALQEFDDYISLYNRTDQGEWWYWKGKPTKQQHGCMSDSPIGLHNYKRLGSLYELEDQFYHNYNQSTISTVDIRPRSSPMLQKFLGSDMKSILNMRLSKNPKAQEYITRVRKHIVNEDPLDKKKEIENATKTKLLK